MAGSTSSSSNVHSVVDDNNNPHRKMVMDVIRINQSYASKCSIKDEESNVDATIFCYLLKDSDELL
jgi:hypothetical protein